MNIIIDKTFPNISIEGKQLPLTRREFDLFIFLWDNRGKICSRNTIRNSIWGFNHYISLRTIDVTIVRLRKKLDNTPIFPKLLTKKGFGYSLVL